MSVELCKPALTHIPHTLHGYNSAVAAQCTHHLFIPHHPLWKTADFMHHSFMTLLAVSDNLMYRNIACET